jgi:hypothetical protein
LLLFTFLFLFNWFFKLNFLSLVLLFDDWFGANIFFDLLLFFAFDYDLTLGEINSTFD